MTPQESFKFVFNQYCDENVSYGHRNEIVHTLIEFESKYLPIHMNEYHFPIDVLTYHVESTAHYLRN